MNNLDEDEVSVEWNLEDEIIQNVKAINDTTYIINPESTHSLTFRNLSENLANQINKLLFSNYIENDYDAVIQLEQLFIDNPDIEIEEINDLIKKRQTEYKQIVDKKIKASDEWDESTDLDKKDMLLEFKYDAMSELEIEVNAELVHVFDLFPISQSLEHEFLSKYGLKAIENYYYFTNIPAIKKAEASSGLRYRCNILYDSGLAVRGKNIPSNEIIEGFSVKELNKYFSDYLEKPISQRAKLIEKLKSIDNIYDVISKNVSLRSIFKVLELPEKFMSVTEEKTKTISSYYDSFVDLITNVYSDTKQDLEIEIN